MSECVCPRTDGYRIRQRDCPVHNECLDSVGPIPKLDGDTYVCVKPKGHDMPHESPNGAWWEPPSLPAQPRRPKESETMRLTEAEREVLMDHIGAWKWESRGLVQAEADFMAAVERILTARSADMEARIRALADEVRTWPRYGPCGFLDEIPANSVEAFIRALLDAAPAGGAE